LDYLLTRQLLQIFSAQGVCKIVEFSDLIHP
jgi:hypothetical protein